MLTTRTRSTHNVEINTGILIKRKGNCGSGNDRPKVIRYRQKSIIFWNAASRSRLASSNYDRVELRAKNKSCSGRVFYAAFFPKNPVIRAVCRDTFPIGPMYRHLREITAVSALDSLG
jgi:hypothetical protein